MDKNTYYKRFFAYAVMGVMMFPLQVTAQSSSSNYRIEESYFGTGGEVDAQSDNFRARQSTGSLGTGSVSGSNFQAVAGANTPSEPFLEMVIMGPDVDLGILQPDTYAFESPRGGDCNCTFYVRSYLASGYSVISASQPPTSENGDVIDAKSTLGSPLNNNSIEEFGINMVANTNPGTFGASPINIPDNTFADGKAADGYSTPNQYKYIPNDIIASSPSIAGNSSIGRTNYTISYIMKSAILTPAGTYTMEHDLILVPTY